MDVFFRPTKRDMSYVEGNNVTNFSRKHSYWVIKLIIDQTTNRLINHQDCQKVETFQLGSLIAPDRPLYNSVALVANPTLEWHFSGSSHNSAKMIIRKMLLKYGHV